MSKIHHLSYRCEKTFEASDTELEKKTESSEGFHFFFVVVVVFLFAFDYFFPQSGNEHRHFL